MDNKKNIEQLLDLYDLPYSHVDRHGIYNQGRDYELLVYIPGPSKNLELQYLFKGCLAVNHKIIIPPASYSIDDRLLDLSRQDEPDYPKAIVWAGIIDIHYLNLETGTRNLKILEKRYGIELYTILIETLAYRLDITFHDLEVNILKEVILPHHKN